MIKMDWCETVAVVAGDAVCSLSKEEFLSRADQVGCSFVPHLSPTCVCRTCACAQTNACADLPRSRW
jgi:hypothetical protein